MRPSCHEAVSDYVGDWLHRAQVSLLTGATGQIKIESHPKKNPGAGLARAWCGPGAGLARASLSRSPTDCDTYLRKLVPKRGWCV